MRVAGADSIPEAPGRLAAWLEQGHQGEMAWMEERTDQRAAPRRLWSEARSVVMLGMSYAPEGDPLAVLGHADKAAISLYARRRDYHDVIKGKLKSVAGLLAAQGGADVKVFVDTAPVMEKPLAQAAGLGWQGKHTNLLARDLGNWFFLGAIFTTLDLAPDAPEGGHCGSCTACLAACPTEAFLGPYRMDARRCISYLTIEHRGPIAEELRARMGNRIYGCDDCLAACPWNKFAAEAREIGYAARVGAPPLAELAALDDAAFRARFAGSPIKRIGRDRMLRNVLYAIGNSGDPALAGAAAPHLNDPDPTIAEAAAWAVARLERPLP